MIRISHGLEVAAALRAKAAKMPRNNSEEGAAADRILAAAKLHEDAANETGSR